MNKKTGNNQRKRLEQISTLLREIRYSTGKNQNEFLEDGIGRRSIQRGEGVNNITLVSLFRLLDCYDNFPVNEFFRDIE